MLSHALSANMKMFFVVYRDLAMSSVNAMLVASDDEINSTVILPRLLDRKADVVVEHFFNSATGISDFSGAFKPLNLRE